MADAKKPTASVDAVVLLDTYSWYDDPADPTSPRNDAVKGDKVSVSPEEFDRSQAMTPHGLAKPGSDEAKADVEPPLTKPDGAPVEDSSAQ